MVSAITALISEPMFARWNTGEQGRRQLETIVQSIKSAGKGKDFDCLLGLSGGMDSSYMLHVVVTEFGLRPLVFHVDGGWNSELAVHNINVLIDKLGLDLYTEVINWEEMRDFQLAWFKSGVPHIDIPQDHAFIATLYNFADKYDIKYILNGGNISTEVVRYPDRVLLLWHRYAPDPRHHQTIWHGADEYVSVQFRSTDIKSTFAISRSKVI